MPGAAPAWLCPQCSAQWCTSEWGDRCACPECGFQVETTHGVFDLRRGSRIETDRGPVTASEIEHHLPQLAGGKPYKAVLEALLNRVPLERGSRLDLLLRESRGSWTPLTRARRGPALFLGNPLSGTLLAIARAGFEPYVIDTSPAFLAWARYRHRALACDSNGVPSAALFASVDPCSELPFPDQTFALVVLERTPANEDVHPTPAECQRVAAEELVVTADNRFGYKRSSGHRGHFRIPSPLEFARRAIVAPAGRQTLWGYRRGLAAPEFAPPRSFALYPHANDFSFVVGLDGTRSKARPQLYLGPKERENRPKMLGYSLGMFPLLTSSFALFSSRRTSASQPSRIRRILEHLAAEIGEGVPEPDVWVSSRGNSAVIHTSSAGSDSDDARQRWTLHLPFSPSQALRVQRNIERLRWIRRERPQLPHPEPLFFGEIDGQIVGCQRRLPGLTAAQISGRVDLWRRLYPQVVEQLSSLVVEPNVRMTEQVFQELVGAKFDLVLRYAHPESTRAALKSMRDKARERLIGQTFPRVLYHADLRSKHLQVQADGSFVSFLDWGSSEPSDLPYFDLLCLLVHERQHLGGLGGADAWKLVREREELADFELAALQDYAKRVGLSPIFCRAIEAMFPVLVGGMSEKNWDFSRPQWMHRLYNV